MSSQSQKDKIDIHTHHIPPPYLSAISKLNLSHFDGMPMAFCSEALSWNMEKQIAHQDSLNISKAYLSISSPGTHLTPGDDQAARELTKACNDWTFSQLSDRIGMFASLPLPDVKGSILEIKRVKALGFNSFVVMTNAHGIYLGDESLDEVWKELDQVNAVITIHPTAPCVRIKPSSLDNNPLISSFWDTSSVLKGDSSLKDGQDSLMIHGNPLLSSFLDPLIEYQFETSRAITSLLLSDSFSKFPNIRYILPHAGATLPPLLDRVLNIAPFLRKEGQESKSPQELRDLLNQKCFFDLAGSPFPNQIQGLLPHLKEPSRQLLYGSDFREWRMMGGSKRTKMTMPLSKSFI